METLVKDLDKRGHLRSVFLHEDVSVTSGLCGGRCGRYLKVQSRHKLNFISHLSNETSKIFEQFFIFVFCDMIYELSPPHYLCPFSSRGQIVAFLSKG